MGTEEKAILLLVEDDESLMVITSVDLKQCGYEVLPAMNGREALEILGQEQVDLILLDVMLPDCSGHEICQKLRSDKYGYQGPIIFMSWLSDSTNIVDAFREGGNDFIVKPVDIKSLVDRIEVNLKDFRRKKQDKRWYKQFMIDSKAHEVYRVEGRQLREKVELSPMEYKLLLALVELPDEVMLYRQLYKKVWGQDDLDDYRPLMVHVSNLRKKIDKKHTEVIRAVRGVGYIFHDA